MVPRVITSSTETIATLMGLVGALMWLSQQPFAERLFRVIPVVVWAFFLAQALSGIGILEPDTSALQGTNALLAPFAILLLTAGTSLREVRALRGAVVFMVAAATVGSIIGVTIAYALFGSFVDPEMWRPLAGMTAGWIGGSGNAVAVNVALESNPDLIGPVAVADSISFIWLSLALFLSAHQNRINKWLFPHAITPAICPPIPSVRASYPQGATFNTTSLGITFGLGAVVTVVSVALGEPLQMLLPNSGLGPFSWTLLVIATVAIILSTTRFQPFAAGVGAPIATYCFYLLMAIQGAQSSFSAITELGVLLPLVATALIIHILVVVLAARIARQDAAMVAVSSWAAIGGVVTAPIVANAYRPSLAPVALVMALVNYSTANYAALFTSRILQTLAP